MHPSESGSPFPLIYCDEMVPPYIPLFQGMMPLADALDQLSRFFYIFLLMMLYIPVLSLFWHFATTNVFRVILESFDEEHIVLDTLLRDKSIIIHLFSTILCSIQFQLTRGRPRRAWKSSQSCSLSMVWSCGRAKISKRGGCGRAGGVTDPQETKNENSPQPIHAPPRSNVASQIRARTVNLGDRPLNSK